MLHPPLPEWKFALRRLRRPAHSSLSSSLRRLCLTGQVLCVADVADADARGLVPPPPAAVSVWFFHPDAQTLASAACAASGEHDLPVPGGGGCAGIESFSSFSSKRFCDAVKFFRQAAARICTGNV